MVKIISRSSKRIVSDQNQARNRGSRAKEEQEGPTGEIHFLQRLVDGSRKWALDFSVHPLISLPHCISGRQREGIYIITARACVCVSASTSCPPPSPCGAQPFNRLQPSSSRRRFSSSPAEIRQLSTAGFWQSSVCDTKRLAHLYLLRRDWSPSE